MLVWELELLTLVKQRMSLWNKNLKPMLLWEELGVSANTTVGGTVGHVEPNKVLEDSSSGSICSAQH